MSRRLGHIHMHGTEQEGQHGTKILYMFLDARTPVMLCHVMSLDCDEGVELIISGSLRLLTS